MKKDTAACFRSPRAVAAGVLIAASSAAFGQMSMEKKDSMSGTDSGRMRGSMTTMMKDMESMKLSGDTDKDFARMMKIHHQGAVEMAQVELKNGKDEKLRTMAKKIIDAQQKEIKEFDDWLMKHK
jgi:uncharacterized protein (DUF305 family)